MPVDPLPVRGLEIHPLQTFVAGPDGAMEYFNSRCRAYTGMPTDDLLGWDWGWVIHPDDLPATRSRWAESIRTGTPHDNDVRIRRADGEFRWFRIRIEPARDADGVIVLWVGASTDIHDLRGAVAEAREARRLVRAFVDRGRDGHALVGADRMVRYASPVLAGMLGVRTEAMLGTDVRDWVHRDDRPRLASAAAGLLARPGERVAGPARLRHADGAFRRVRLEAANLLPDPDVRAVALTVAADDAG